MLGAAILWIGLGAAGAGDYPRPFAAKSFDQATLDAEGFGEKRALTREDDGLRVKLAPGEPEAGWKTPSTLRIGGDCTITATLVVRKLPKPGQEDGVAIGLAVATQNIDQPEATLLRQVEPDGKEVFRSVDKGAPAAPMMNQMMFDPFGGGMIPNKPAKPSRPTFPARGSTIRLEVRRQGQTLRYQVFDEFAAQPREIGQFQLGPGDIAGVKLFASNRNGSEAVEVLFRDLTIHADRISGLGTAVRTIFGTVVHGEPTALEGGTLIVGGMPPAPAPNPSANPGPAAPAQPLIVPAGAAALAPLAPPPAPAPPPQVAVAAKTATTVVEAVAPGPAAAPGAAGPPAPPKPKVRIPLDEVDTIAFERSSALSAQFRSQPNVDTTMPGGVPANDGKGAKKSTPGDDLSAPPPGTAPVVAFPKVEPRPNGIRDLHLALSGLREVAIQGIMIMCPTDKGPAQWRLDTTGSQDWPLVLRRAGLETWADMFLEPPVADCHGKEFTITVMYADGQNAIAKVKPTEHTDPKLAFNAEAPTPALDARIYLAGDEQLFGQLEAITNDVLSLSTPWGDRVDVPLSRVVGVYMGMPDHKETPEAFARRLKAPGNEDLLLARAKDGGVVAIAGVVEGAKANKLTFLYQGKGRTLPLKGVEGLILASRPGPKPPKEVRPTFSMAGGIVVSGRWAAIEAAAWQVETPWGQMLKLPAAEVRHVRFRGGQMTYLSDLEPSQVDETPYFGRRLPFRKDVNLVGATMRLQGQVIERGLAVHSRSALTYDLNRDYATFEADVGFDDAVGQKGRVDCRVFADGKELYANPDLRADAPPVHLSLPVAGAEQLKLVIDFGPDEDTGDRVIWANARVYRRVPGHDSAARAATPNATGTPPASGR
jgi:hypothetical protein